MANAEREPPQVRTAREQKVFDDRGGEYTLGERLSRGGQGTVVRIKGNARQIVKLANAKADDQATVAWARQLDRIRYLPIQDMGLPVVMPLAYISNTRANGPTSMALPFQRGDLIHEYFCSTSSCS